MKRKIKFIYLILGFIILPCVSGIFSQTIETREPNQCGLITDGIEFCIETPLVSVEEGKDVFITYSMKNITNEEITTRFGRNSGKEHFAIKITDENGNKVLTILEKLAEKRKSEMSSQEDQIFIIRSGYGPATLCFETREKLNWNLNLSKSYSFDKKGRYYVEVNRNNTEQKDGEDPSVLLGKIEIEIK